MPATCKPAGGVNETAKIRLDPLTGVQDWMTQLCGHASPSSVLQSSHVSPGSTTQLPHAAVGCVVVVVPTVDVVVVELVVTDVLVVTPTVVDVVVLDVVVVARTVVDEVPVVVVVVPVEADPVVTRMRCP